MSFSNKTIGAVAKEFQIQCAEDNFIVEATIAIADYFRADFELILQDAAIDNSENAICENLIYPILKEIWKSYRHQFLLWSHQTLIYNEKLSGVPDYVLAKRSPLGKVVFDKPYFLAIEAKQDKFEEGWGQCLAELVAVREINRQPEQTVFGIVSNGKIWQFGKLQSDIFTKNKIFYTIQNLEQLFAAINYIFQERQLQLETDRG